MVLLLPAAHAEAPAAMGPLPRWSARAPRPHGVQMVRAKAPAACPDGPPMPRPLAPVPSEAVEYYGDEFMNHPVGTGPFMLDSWTRGSKLVMARNPKFREEKYPHEGEDGDEQAGLLVDAGKALPLIDRAEYRVILEDQPYWLTFMNGETDAAGIPKDAFDSAINSDRELTGRCQF